MAEMWVLEETSYNVSIFVKSSNLCTPWCRPWHLVLSKLLLCGSHCVWTRRRAWIPPLSSYFLMLHLMSTSMSTSSACVNFDDIVNGWPRPDIWYVLQCIVDLVRIPFISKNKKDDKTKRMSPSVTRASHIVALLCISPAAIDNKMWECKQLAGIVPSLVIRMLGNTVHFGTTSQKGERGNIARGTQESSHKAYESTLHTHVFNNFYFLTDGLRKLHLNGKHVTWLCTTAS